MHVLVVISHPNPASFTHALAARCILGAERAGASHEIADLHAEDYDPRWSMADLQDSDDGPIPEDTAREQARITRADALVFAFPLFWFGMPAMLKGWLDRVWRYGWAFGDGGAVPKTLLPLRPAAMLIPAGGNPADWEARGLDPAMRVLWTGGLMDYFGMPNIGMHILAGAEGSLARRQAHLDTAEQIGRDLVSARPPEMRGRT